MGVIDQQLSLRVDEALHQVQRCRLFIQHQEQLRSFDQQQRWQECSKVICQTW